MPGAGGAIVQLHGELKEGSGCLLLGEAEVLVIIICTGSTRWSRRRIWSRCCRSR